MGVFKFEPAGSSWDAHERNWWLTRRTAEQRKIDGPGYGLTGKSVALAVTLAVTGIVGYLRHEGDLSAERRAVSDSVAMRLGHPQDADDVLGRLIVATESILRSATHRKPQEIIIKLKEGEDGAISTVTVNDVLATPKK